jgi:uncharacterized protein (TIRG00374 family)
MNDNESTSSNGGASWIFVSTDTGRARRPADIGLAVVGALLIVVTAFGVHQLQWMEDFASELVALLPSWLETFFAILYAVGFVFALLILIMAIANWSTMAALVRDLAIAIGLTVVVILGLSYLVTGEFPIVIPEFYSGGNAGYPVARVAVVTAMLVVAGPALVRPMRRAGWAIVIAMGLIALALGYGLLGDTFGGLGIGLMSASIVLGIFGSPRALPDVRDVDAGLADLGLEVDDVRVADFQSWGARDFSCTTAGAESAVRVYGRDAKDAQIINRWWRALWYRDSGPKLTSSRLHLVEHEALMTMTARDHGIAVQGVLAAGEPTPKTALIALTARGTAMNDTNADAVPDGVFVELWRSVAQLHEAGIAHGRLNAHAVRVDGDEAVLGNFYAASVAAPQSRMYGDVTELLASLADSVGTERAVIVAREGLGDAALTDALPYMQRSAVSTEGRDEIPSKKSFFADIRNEVASQLGVDQPEPAQITRINWRTILMFALSLTAAYALIGMLADIDWSEVWSELQDASWGWIILGLIVATSTLVTEAYSLMAAVTAAVPLRPTVQLESAIKFVQLAVGGAAGRMATNIAFLRKFGVSATDSVTQGGVDSFSGFVIQALILVLAGVFGNLDLIPDDATSDVDWLMLIAIVLIAVVLSVVIWRRVPVIREKVLPTVKQMWNGLKELGKDPSRLVRLFGANLGSNLLYGLALWLTAVAFGEVLPYMSIVVVYVAMALLSGLVPIPGGVGVSEAVLTTGLVAIGVDQSVAFAIAVTFRVSSAYLPPVWGWFSLQWLQRNEYL